MTSAAGAYASAAQAVAVVSGRITSTTSSVVGTAAWIGAGGIAFSLRAHEASVAAKTAAAALGPVSVALTALAAELDAALVKAKQAEVLADQVNAATNQLNGAYDQRVTNAMAANLAAPPLPLLNLATPTLPTPAELGAASHLIDQANQARQAMDAANAQARAAWQSAAGNFDAITAQAPSVQSAIVQARAKADAKARAAHQSNFWGGLGSLALGGVAWVGDGVLGVADVAQAGLDPVTDGATVADTAAATDLTSAGMADLAGSGASAAELATAADTAAAATTADGAALDNQVADFGWQDYEARFGGQQTPMETVFNGEPINVRLDAPVQDEGIIDFKHYNWDSPSYQKPFIQDRVAASFEKQIQVYQTISPKVTLQFSQAPPDWVIQAIEKVGGHYIVVP